MTLKARSARLELCKLSHLLRAWQKIAKRNRRSHGLDQVTIEAFQDNLQQHLQEISSQLGSGTYRFSPARGALVPKGDGGRRPIKVPAVRDRVVLKAIQLLIENRFSAFNLDCSFGYVKGRNVRDAIERVERLAKEGYATVLEADIRSFFDTVDRDLLIKRFIGRIRFRSLVGLVEEALRAEVGNLEMFTDEERGLFPGAESGIPQGGVLSPMLANFYLYPFDKAMTDAGFRVIRYADDFVVMCKTQQEANDAWNLARKILEDELRLELHPLGGPQSKTRIQPFNKGVEFLGVRFGGNRVLPCDKVVEKFRKRVKAILSNKDLSLLATLRRLSNTIVGWGQFYADLDVQQLYSELDPFILRELSTYFRQHQFLFQGRNLSNRQRKLLGIPALVNLTRGKKRPA